MKAALRFAATRSRAVKCPSPHLSDSVRIIEECDSLVPMIVPGSV